MRFTDDVAKVVKPNGYFIASGIIQPKKEDVKMQLLASGFKLKKRFKWKIGSLNCQEKCIT